MDMSNHEVFNMGNKARTKTRTQTVSEESLILDNIQYPLVLINRNARNGGGGLIVTRDGDMVQVMYYSNRNARLLSIGWFDLADIYMFDMTVQLSKQAAEKRQIMYDDYARFGFWGYNPKRLD
jgi:hypothetical protein